jgi:hypothetical protein
MSERDQTRLDWLGALKNPVARRIFGMMIHSAAFQRSHIYDSALETAFNEGVRSVSLNIKELIEMAMPGETAVLLAEIMKEKQDEQRTLRNVSNQNDAEGA